ncbi:unnamed protein product, partial [marine sediment metagenome]
MASEFTIGKINIEREEMMRFKWLSVIFMIMACWFSLSCQGQKIWPTEGWKKSSPATQGINEKFLSDLDKKITNGDYGYVDGFIVIRNGYLVYEKFYINDYIKINEGIDDSKWQYNYNNPDWHPFYKGTKLHTLQSVTKSVTSAAIGVAIGREEVPGVDVKIVDIFKDEEIANLDERKKRMTLEDVLT